MKYLPLIFLFNCGYSIPENFLISDDSLPDDVRWLQESAMAINDHLGCEAINLFVNTGVYTPADMDHGRNFISFTSQKQTADYMKNTKGLEDALGVTYTYQPTYQEDILLTSFAQYPPKFICLVSGPDETGHTSCKDGFSVNYEAAAKRMMIHEFGHSMGLSHTKETSDIMYPEIFVEYTSDLNETQWKNYVDQLHAVGVTCKNKH